MWYFARNENVVAIQVHSKEAALRFRQMLAWHSLPPDGCHSRSDRYERAIDCDTKRFGGAEGFPMWRVGEATCSEERGDPCRKMTY